MPYLPNGGTSSWTVEPRSEFESFFLEDRAIQNGWFVSFVQHPRFGSGWNVYQDPIKTLVALELSEVAEVLDEVARGSESGFFAAGFVSFDAAPAFDAAFESHRHESSPLACFHVYENPPRFYKELLCTYPVEKLKIDWLPELEKEQYLEKCQRVKDHLAAGDTYQVNLSLRLQGQVDAPLASVFANLVAENPPPYASLFLSEHAQVASLSPELFFERSGTKIRCRPMKGTAPIGSDSAETAAIAESLQASEKDRAENLMILDMIRNDLGKIADIGTVQATSIFEVEAFSTVLQMTSTVEAEVRLPLRETFDALFPCASIVGAPKVETMKIIRELEESPRGVYSGAIGVVLPNQEAKFAVAIRTISQLPGSSQCLYGAGSGIVWDSEPEAEWRETLLKTEALHRSSAEWALIETFRWPDLPGNALVALHLDRMGASAHRLGIPFDHCAAAKTVQSACESSSHPLRVRLLLTHRGDLQVENEPLALPPSLLPAKIAKKPVCSEDPSLLVKTNRRSLYIRHLLDAGVDEVLLWNERGEVTEFCKGNLVAKIQGRLVTPPVECGLLPGVLRGQLIRSKEIHEEKIDFQTLSTAEELYRINSLTGWIKVHLVEN